MPAWGRWLWRSWLTCWFGRGGRRRSGRRLRRRAASEVTAQARYQYRAVREIYPQLEGIPYEYHWGNLVAVTRDHLPRLQEVAPGLLAGFGYNGRGVAMATMMGALLARWSSGQPAAELGFPVTPVDPLPLHVFNQLGARIAVQYLRTLDGLARIRARFA